MKYTTEDLREQMSLIDQRADGLTTSEIDQLSEHARDSLAYYVVADAAGIPDVPVPVEWEALVGRNPSRPLALLITALGVPLADIEKWAEMPECRLARLLREGERPTIREMAGILVGIADMILTEHNLELANHEIREALEAIRREVRP